MSGFFFRPDYYDPSLLAGIDPMTGLIPFDLPTPPAPGPQFDPNALLAALGPPPPGMPTDSNALMALLRDVARGLQPTTAAQPDFLQTIQQLLAGAPVAVGSRAWADSMDMPMGSLASTDPGGGDDNFGPASVPTSTAGLINVAATDTPFVRNAPDYQPGNGIAANIADQPTIMASGRAVQSMAEQQARNVAAARETQPPSDFRPGTTRICVGC